MLSQQLQSLRELLQKHVSARRHQPGGNDRARGADGEQVRQKSKVKSKY